jgi:hypothetical protein
MARSWRPPPKVGAGWVHVRPLREPRPPGETSPQQPPKPAGALLAPDHRAAACPGPAHSSSPTPLPLAPGTGRSRWGPGSHAPARNPTSASNATTTRPTTPTAGGHRARPARPLDNTGPHGCGRPAMDLAAVGLRRSAREIDEVHQAASGRRTARDSHAILEGCRLVTGQTSK